MQEQTTNCEHQQTIASNKQSINKKRHTATNIKQQATTNSNKQQTPNKKNKPQVRNNE